MRKSKITKEMLQIATIECYSVAAIIKHFGLTPCGGQYTRFNRMLRYHDIDISHFKGQGWSKGLTAETSDIVKRTNLKNTYSDEEILIENSPYSRASRLRPLMIKYGKNYSCGNQRCNIINTWLGQDITLHIDHINGINNDNRLENLRFLCPNCHTQTATWGKRNKP